MQRQCTIARALGVSLAQLTSENSIVGIVSEQLPGVSWTNTQEIPIVGTTQAGPDRNWFELEYPAGFGDGYVELPVKNDQCYALRVIGDSMMPVIVEGQAVICDPSREPVAGDYVVAVFTDGSVMVKLLRSVRDGRLTLDSSNPAIGPVVRKLQDVEFMHAVVAIAMPNAVRWR